MHPPRRKGALPRPRLVDRLTDGLSTYCPFSTLAALTLLITGSAVTIPHPVAILSLFFVADVGVNVARRRRGPGKRRARSAIARNAPV